MCGGPAAPRCCVIRVYSLDAPYRGHRSTPLCNPPLHPQVTDELIWFSRRPVCRSESSPCPTSSVCLLLTMAPAASHMPHCFILLRIFLCLERKDIPSGPIQSATWAGVFVSRGSHKKASQTGALTGGSLFSPPPESKGSKVKAPAGTVSSETSLLGL